MAKSGINIESQVSGLITEIESGSFRSVYLLMGEEPYYLDKLCDAILENAVDPQARDFDQFVYYGSDTDADTVMSSARSYSMFGGRVLVMVKEAQLMEDIENLSIYCEKPLDSTVLVVCLHGASLDKRKSFYKQASKVGVVVDSPALRDYEMPAWIQSYYSKKGLRIDPRGAQLLSESVGTEISKVVFETDKLLKNLPEGVKDISVEAIEKNVGISRQFSVFELAKELSYRNAAAALKIAAHIGGMARFAMPMAVSALYSHFNKLLRLEAYLASNPGADNASKASAIGINPFFLKEYDTAARNYPIRKTMGIVSLLVDYDYKGKGGDSSVETDPKDLLIELVTKILNI